LVVASLVAEIEVAFLDESGRSLGIGQPGRLQARVLTRRIGSEGRPAPDSIAAPSPLVARFEGPPEESTLPGGVIESARVVAVEIPATTPPGNHRESVVLGWAGGQTWAIPFTWQVVPGLKATPSTLILDPSRGPADIEVIVRSADRPFRINSVSGALVAAHDPLPFKLDRTQAVRFTLDVAKVTPGTTTDVVLATDAPDQPTLDLKVVILPTGGETRHEKAP